MKQLFSPVIALPLVLCGCGGSNSPEGLTRSALDRMNELAGVLESVKDKATADAAVAKIDQLAGQLTELGKKMDGLKLSIEELEKGKKQFGPDIMKAEGRLDAALMALRQKAPDGFDPVNNALNKHGMGHIQFQKVGKEIGGGELVK